MGFCDVVRKINSTEWVKSLQIGEARGKNITYSTVSEPPKEFSSMWSYFSAPVIHDLLGRVQTKGILLVNLPSVNLRSPKLPTRQPSLLTRGSTDPRMEEFTTDRTRQQLHHGYEDMVAPKM